MAESRLDDPSLTDAASHVGGGERTALDRMKRTMYFAIGVAAIIFGVLLAPGPSGFLGQIGQIDTPFMVFSVAVGLVLPGLFAVFAYLLPHSVLRGLVTAVGIGFVACQLLFPLALKSDTLANHGTPWLQGFGAFPATLIAVAWSGRVTWVFALMQGPIVVLVGLTSKDDSAINAVLEGLGATVSCSIFAGVSVAVVMASARLDAVAQRAREQASLEAGALTREREQSRINAMVHDDIMSVLLSASRKPVPAGLAVQAKGALASVEELASSEQSNRPYAPEELIALLRATVGEAGPDIDFTYGIDADDDIPPEVVAALSEATEEAIRNSLLHAGPATERSVTVTASPTGMEVVVKDNGQGFTVRDVPQRRLGLRVSILERMRSLPGGDARVRSQPGAGTRITLRWTRP